MEFTQQEQDDIFYIIAAILHLGNVGFSVAEGKAVILKPDIVDTIAKVRIYTVFCDISKISLFNLQRASKIIKKYWFFLNFLKRAC